MINKFNVSRYRELLKYQDIRPEESDFLALAKDPNYRELLSYEESVHHQIYFSQKSQYCLLIEKYLATTISPHIFRVRFLEMVKQNDEKADKILKDFKQLSNFSIDAYSDEFSSLFERIYNKCLQVFEFGTDDDGYGIPEDKFRNSIEKIYLKIQEVLNQE